MDSEFEPFDDTVAALRAAAEPTRLRILALLSTIDLTVGELSVVLAQSQPRVSRHLKILVEAELLERHAEGTSAFFRPVPPHRRKPALDAVLSLVDVDDPAMRSDRKRLDTIRAERAESAAEYFGAVAADWDRVRDLHVADDEVEAELVSAVEDRPSGELLDVGTGTGRMLELFADRVTRGVGIDLSRAMLNVARTNLDKAGLRHCSVRHGDVYDLAVPAGSFDIAILHHVLHYLDDPSAAVAESARTIRANGSLLIVDFAPHQREALRSEFEHRFLGFTDEEVARWCRDAGLDDIETRHLERTDLASEDGLTTTIWIARQRADAPDLRTLENAS